MTREEAINEINKVFTSAYANYIVTALTEGATVSDFQRRYGRAYEAGVKDGLEQKPCEDAVSRKSVIAIIQNHWWNCRDIDKLVNELPPVTPQEPTTAVVIPKGATNGDALKVVFPNLQVVDVGFHRIVAIFGGCRNMMYRNSYDEEWWNAEYKELTTKNDLGADCSLDDFIKYCKRTFGVELTVKKSDNPDTYAKLFGTIKNGLVDWENYKDVDGNSLDDLILDVIQRNFDCGNTYGYKVADEIIGLLPSVTPQEPNTWSLDDAREDFMYDVYNELGFLPTNEEANRIIDSFDRVTSSIEQEHKWIPVTERLPEEGYSVLVMRITDDNYKYMRVATYQGDCWMDNTDKFNKPNPHKVIAWMPLPQPYKAESESE